MKLKKSLKKNVKRLFRGVKFVLKSLLLEKPQGIDFSLRQKSLGIKRKGSHGYALTQKKSFDNIMKKIDICADDKFIDIGCGKGGVLLHASHYPFKRIAGLEIEDSLYEIAVKNFEKLKMPEIELFHDDATNFDNYAEFNVYFLFNPFEPDIYAEVIDAICATINRKRKDPYVYLICYGRTISPYIAEKGLFELIENYEDEIRMTSVNIWKWTKKSRRGSKGKVTK